MNEEDRKTRIIILIHESISYLNTVIKNYDHLNTMVENYDPEQQEAIEYELDRYEQARAALEDI